MPEPIASLRPYLGKIYVGRLVDSVHEVEVYKGAICLGRLRPRKDLWTAGDCPGRFGWGVGGDRDAYLALAILADALVSDAARAQALHLPFREKTIDRLPAAGPWQLTYCQVSIAIASIEDAIQTGEYSDGL